MSDMQPVTSDPPLRVWRLNDCDWVVARTLTEAIDCLCSDTGMSREEAVDDDARALTPADMDRLTFYSDEELENVVNVDGSPIYKRWAFAVELQRLIDAGVAFPRIFASTEV